MQQGRSRAFGDARVHGALNAVRRVSGMGPYVEGLEVKPKPHFDRGLFMKGRGRMRRGGVVPQFNVRTPQDGIARSDDVLGPSIALVGLGVHHGEQRPNGAHVVLEDAFAPRLARRGWCAVVRPERTVLHDAPAADAERIASEVIALIATGTVC